LKISIITVTFNSELYIADCLASVEAQKYHNIEHIVIDGGSTDKTTSIVKKFPHIKKIVSEPDEGIYDAMNKGISFATGGIIGFLNSDDFYTNNEVISSIVKKFESDLSLDACYADLIYVDQLNVSKTIRYFKSCKFKEKLFSKGWCPPHPTFFVRQSVYERFGKFDLTYNIASDVDLMMRFLEKYKIKSLYTPNVWVKMRMGGTTNKNLKNIWLQNKEILNSLNSNGLTVNPIRFFGYKIISRLFQFFKRPSV
jgi:glycosyltransferase involved in cell wall biosynthesis